MKVLMLHNRYKIMGGEDVSTNAEYSLLKSNGIDIETLFINNDSIEHENKLKLAFNTIWSTTYYKEIFNKIKHGKYDIIHVQNFFPLFSPSIFYAAKKAGVKIVMTVRNYRLICPNGLMYINNSICKACVGKTIPYPAISKRCYRDSYGASAVAVTMLGVHNLVNTWRNKIDGFICISEFVKHQLLLGGFALEQLYVKHNFVATEVPPNFTPEDYYIYVGRISTEKGIDVLLHAFQMNKKKLIIIGDGPLKQDVIDASKENKHIQFLGKLPLAETYQKIADAKALVFPSKWHEPFGRTIVESFAHGTPVIGSALGGVTELIQDGYNGLLFNPSDPSGLSEAIKQFENITDSFKIRENSYLSYKAHFDPSSNFTQLMDVYNHVLSK